MPSIAFFHGLCVYSFSLCGVLFRTIKQDADTLAIIYQALQKNDAWPAIREQGSPLCYHTVLLLGETMDLVCTSGN